MELEDIKKEFDNCNSLQDLANVSMKLKDMGASVLAVNRARMVRYKELLNSNNSFTRIPKEQIYLPEEKEPVCSIMVNMQIFKTPAIIVLEQGIVF